MEDKLMGGSSKSAAPDRFICNWIWGKKILYYRLNCIQQIKKDQESRGQQYIWETEMFWHAQGAGMCNDYQVSMFAVPPATPLPHLFFSHQIMCDELHITVRCALE